MKNYYFILGLNIYATDAQIKQAFRRLALQFHPDKNSSPEAEAIFKEINEAYEVLGNGTSKAQYDLLLRGVTSGPAPVKQHRDPRYRPRPKGAYSTKTKKQELIEIMAAYLKYAILISRVALIFCAVILIDYNLPYQVIEQKVVGAVSRREYRSGRSFQLQFDDGGKLSMNRSAAMEFKPGSSLLMYKTFLFDIPVLLENRVSHFTTRVPISVYGNFIFAPLIMFITSLLGAFYWKGVEFRFNLGVVNFFLMLLTFLFLRIHLLSI